MIIMLYGFLGKKYGKVHKFAVKTPAEAIKALCANYKTFRKDVIDGGAYKVVQGGKHYLEGSDLHSPQSSKESLKIIPVVTGAGNNPWVRIIIGAIIMYFTYGTKGYELWFAAGASLAMSGVSQLLFSPPETNREERDTVNNRASYGFNGAVNTVAQGNPVPICYGKLLVGSQIISAGFTTLPVEP